MQVINNSFDRGGNSTHLVNLQNYFLEEGWEVHRECIILVKQYLHIIGPTPHTLNIIFLSSLLTRYYSLLQHLDKIHKTPALDGFKMDTPWIFWKPVLKLIFLHLFRRCRVSSIDSITNQLTNSYNCTAGRQDGFDSVSTTRAPQMTKLIRKTSRLWSESPIRIMWNYTTTSRSSGWRLT